MNKNEASARVAIDAMLAGQGWQTADANAVRYEVMMAAAPVPIMYSATATAIPWR